jgi:CelD/BcsL family acetyltransferase involved in cellulose biosynthesis
MQVRVKSPANLTSRELALWQSFRSSQHGTDSPFLDPAYTTAIHRFRPNVEIAVLGTENAPVGFFPFERQRRKAAHPPGGMLCDLQGIVSQAPWNGCMRELLAKCDLTTWHFSQLLTFPQTTSHVGILHESSPYVALAGGYQQWSNELRSRGSACVKRAGQKMRRLVRDHGPVRFEWDSHAPRILQQLCQWKTQQRMQTRSYDVLQHHWVCGFLESLLEFRTESFGTLLSGLYAGQRLIAAQLSLRSNQTAHYWMAAYDPAFASYSPGHLLFLNLLEQCSQQNVTRVDLGIGLAPYKTRLMTGTWNCYRGTMDTRPVPDWCWKATTLLGRIGRLPLMSRLLSQPRTLWRHYQAQRSMQRS